MGFAETFKALSDPVRREILVMLKDEKNKFLMITTIVCLLPLILSFVLYEKLPKEVAIHFNGAGVADNYVPKAVAACGNYMPKCKQNYTVGIKLPWTLSSEENWNKTHHLAGYLWILGGISIIISSCIRISSIPLTLVVILIITIIPFLYSFWLYKKGV